ncbi:MAG: hypothetical protein ABL893_17020, partial [Hyphomicrobium sp.]
SSSMTWNANGLTIDIDEVGVPVPKRIRGQIRLHPSAIQPTAFALDDAGHHMWQPIAPLAAVDVHLTAPELTWKGHGYFDRNTGNGPLEDTFQHWHWSRASIAGSAKLFYDVTPRAGAPRQLALSIDGAGSARAIALPPPTVELPSTGWRIGRETHSDAGSHARVISTLEDTPFYARSIISSCIDGRPAVSMHESLNLDRFRSPIVQALLPVRMPRRARQSAG